MCAANMIKWHDVRHLVSSFGTAWGIVISVKRGYGGSPPEIFWNFGLKWCNFGALWTNLPGAKLTFLKDWKLPGAKKNLPGAKPVCQVPNLELGTQIRNTAVNAKQFQDWPFSTENNCSAFHSAQFLLGSNFKSVFCLSLIPQFPYLTQQCVTYLTHGMSLFSCYPCIPSINLESPLSWSFLASNLPCRGWRAWRLP